MVEGKVMITQYNFKLCTMLKIEEKHYHMLSHGIACYHMVLHCITWYHMVSHGMLLKDRHQYQSLAKNILSWPWYLFCEMCSTS